MSQHPDVLILGGGIIGLTTAYFLAREGMTVDVVDQGDFGQEASWAGAGILPPGNPQYARTPFDRLRAVSVEQFAALSAELRDRTGIDNGYLVCGGIEFPEAGEAAAEQEWHGEGIRFELLDEATLRRLEPAVGSDRGGTGHLPDMAQLRNPRHVRAMLVGCRALGVRLHSGCPVHGFERREGHVTAARTAEGLMQAGQYLLAAGAWTDALLEPFGCRPGIRPIRGQIALLNPGVPLFRHILLQGPRYLVPRPDGRVLVGSTEEDVGFNKHTTAGAILDLLKLAAGLVPGLAQAHLERCWAGLRPGSPDGLPFLGPVPECDNLFVAAGHFRAGIQLSPGTAGMLRDLLLGREPDVPWEPFRVDRPGPAA